MDKEFKVPKRKQPVFRITAKILRLFYKKPEIINLAGELPDKAIVLSNHCAKSGPMTMELYYPKFNVKWGAHEMLGNYISRLRYLRDVYYVQKRGLNKFFATIFASFEAAFAQFFYKGMKFIGTYPDARVKKTLEESVTVLDSDMTVMIFPEDSSKGYFEVITEFIPGFVLLASQYYKKTVEDLPVYPVHYNKKHSKLIIGEPVFVNR